MTPHFGMIVVNWLQAQPKLSFLLPCCWSPEVVHFIKANGDDIHIASVLRIGRFHRKESWSEDVWDKGVPLSLEDPKFFEKLHDLLVQLDKR